MIDNQRNKRQRNDGQRYRQWVWCLIAAALMLHCLSASQAAFAQQAVAQTRDVQIDGDYNPLPYHLPPIASEHGGRVDQLINWLHVFMALLFTGWGIFFVYCLVQFRERPGHKARHHLTKAKVSKYVEVAVAVFEAVILLGFAMPLWAMTKNELPPADDADVTRIHVVAEQFAWNFHYPGEDGIFGRTAIEHIDLAVNPVGIDPSDPNGADDLQSGELHFPVDKIVVAEVTSKDVIHSFALNVMRVKQDVIPGMRIPVWFKPVKTGTYEVGCAQLCGNNHYSMRALMVVEPDEASFAAWLDTQKVEEFDEDDLD